ncbi:MAG: hypothetical protein AB1553_05515 [Nitrospirota bacterium]
MKMLKWMLLVALIFLIQTQFSSLKNFFNGAVILVYLFGLKSRQDISLHGYFSSKTEIKSTLFGAFLGLAEDILSGSIIGPGLLSKGLLGLIAPVIFTDMVFRWTPLWGGIVMALFTLIDGGIIIGSRVLFTGIEISGFTAFQVMVVQAVMSIPFGIIVKPQTA